MIIKKEDYTIVKCTGFMFGYIHRNVAKEKRLALQAVLKQQKVYDITDILFLNTKMLSKKESITSYTGKTNTVIPFKNFDFMFLDDKLCHIIFKDGTTITNNNIMQDNYLYNFLKKFINKNGGN